MTDDPGLQITSRDSHSSLVRSGARSSIVARGRRDAAALTTRPGPNATLPLAEIRRLAEQGDASAQANLGAIYSNGRGVPEDHDEAVRWYRKAAEQGVAAAENSLGYMFLRGLGVPRDTTESIRWFRKAAERGYAIAQVGLGRLLYDSKAVAQDYAEAARWFRKAAEQGDAAGEYSLGLMCYEGKGVPQDHSEAERWFRKAAAHLDDAAEEHSLDYGYEAWYRMAWTATKALLERRFQGEGQYSETRTLAEHGDANAQVKLGEMYGSGQGVFQDYAEAARWYRKAAESGSRLAAEQLGYLYYDGVPGVAQNYAEAVKWLRKSTRTEFGVAEFCLGTCYFYGLHVRQDYGEAARWLLENLQTDVTHWDETCYLLSRIYALDEAVRQRRWPAEGEAGWEEYADDAKHHRRSAEKGHDTSKFCLGLAYAYGLGVTRDEAEAVRWWRKAAEAGEFWSQFHLATAFDKGRGVPQDYVRAHMWFDIAASVVAGIHLKPFSGLRDDPYVGNEQKYVLDARDVLARKMTTPQIAEAQRLAREWKLTAGDEGHQA